MKLIKKIIPFLFLASLLAGCNNSNSSSSDVNMDSSPTTSVDDYVPLPAKDVDSFDRTYVKMVSNSLYVNKVENLSDQNFIMGMDASSVIAEENSGVKYYDYEGNETDVFKVLSDSGINYIRVRIWNNPYDNWRNKASLRYFGCSCGCWRRCHCYSYGYSQLRFRPL